VIRKETNLPEVMEAIGKLLEQNRFHIQPDAWEAFGHLGIHVLVEADLGQLWPEGDVQAQCQFQSRVNVRVGQNAHSRRMQVAFHVSSIILVCSTLPVASFDAGCEIVTHFAIGYKTHLR